MKFLTPFNFDILVSARLLFLSILLISCEKEYTIQTTKPLLNNSNILQDSAFKILLSDIQEVSFAISNASSDKILSQNEFELIYNKAIKENDNNSKNEISKIMGYSDYSLFWETRKRILNNIGVLNKKYNLNKLSAKEMKGIINSGLANKNRSNISSKGKTIFMYNPECQEIYKNCLDQATATYAVEQVGCVGLGVFGWTIVGGALFVACEAASNYHLYVNDRACRTNLKYCQ